MCDFKKLTKEQFDIKINDMLTRETDQMRGWIDELIDCLKEAKEYGGFDEHEPYHEINLFEGIVRRNENLACMVDSQTFYVDLRRYCDHHICGKCPLCDEYKCCRITNGRLTFEDIEKAQTYEPYEDNRDELISDLIGWISEHIYKDEDLVEVLKANTSITAEQLKEYVD